MKRMGTEWFITVKSLCKYSTRYVAQSILAIMEFKYFTNKLNSQMIKILLRNVAITLLPWLVFTQSNIFLQRRKQGWRINYVRSYPESNHTPTFIYPFPWICVVFFTAVKNCFTSDENTLSKKKNISCPTTSQANCSVNRMICSRFLSDYLEIFSAAPRKSLDNHSKTSHRSSCFPHSFFEVVEHENYYFRHFTVTSTLKNCWKH